MAAVHRPSHNVNRWHIADMATKHSSERAPGAKPSSPWMERAVVGVLGGLSRLFMQVFSSTKVSGRERLVAAVEERDEGVGLVTVSNHVSIYDDPFTVAAAVPWMWLWDTHKLRSTLCATNRCFFHPVIGKILSLGRVLPVQRGDGMYQPYMDDVVARVAAGEWIHLFPEGTRTALPPAMLPLRPGIGRLVADPPVTPVVLPLVHVGMHTLAGRGSVVPSVGQAVTIVVGEPVAFDDLLAAYAPGSVSDLPRDEREALYNAIALRLQRVMHNLLLEANAVHHAQPH